jgi:hypothetical protein
MPRRATSSTAAILILTASLTAAPGAQTVPEAEVKAEVRATWDSYIEAFSAGRTDVIAHEIYSAPSFRTGAEGAAVLGTAAETQASFDATHRQLAPERYDHSETDRAEICVINAGTALLSAYFTRYRTDGTVLSTGASSYLFAKVGGEWRILAIMANPARKLIGCD